MKQLAVMWQRANIERDAKRLLEHCESEEPKLLLYMAHMKRIRKVPDAVSSAAIHRFNHLWDAAGIRRIKNRERVEATVMHELWNQMSDEEARVWLLKVK